jgi:hypothetical protein
MKNLLNFTFSSKLLLIAIVLFSCTKHPVANSNNITEKQSAENFKVVGEMHNNRLNQLFLKINSNESSISNSTKNNSSNINMNRSSMLIFVKNASIQQINDDQTLSASVKNQMTNLTSTIFQDIPIMENNNLYNTVSSFNYSQVQLNFINELNTILSDDDESIYSLLERITLLEVEIYNSDIPLIQQDNLYIITNTAKSSLLYWNQNINKWNSMLTELVLSSNSTTTEIIKGLSVKSSVSKKFSWKKVAKGDVGGAVAGVASFGGAALLGGPTTLVAFGSAVGGWAAGCSAYEAIMQLW